MSALPAPVTISERHIRTIIGRRITLIVPAWYHGHTQPIEMIDERWESFELNLLIHSEYRLSNIRRIELPARRYVSSGTSAMRGPEAWTCNACARAPRSTAICRQALTHEA